MGIKKFFKIIKELLVERELKDFEGKTAAVDIMQWLYRGMYACRCRGIDFFDAMTFLGPIRKLVAKFRFHRIKLIFVIDGLPVDLKADTLQRRKTKKLENTLRANLAENTTDEIKFAKQSLDIKNEHISYLIEYLIKENIEFVIAPNESDAQLSHMSMNGQVDFILTEDSDVCIFGAENIAYKIELESGKFLYWSKSILSEKLTNLKAENKHMLKDYEIFLSLTPEQRINFVVLMGCDYIDNIEGIGPSRALKIAYNDNSIDEIVNTLERSYEVPDLYKLLFYKIKIAFKHQIIFNNRNLEICYMNDKNILFLEPTDLDIKLHEVYSTYVPESLFSVVKETIGVISKVDLKFVSGLTMYESHPNPDPDIVKQLETKIKQMSKKNKIESYFKPKPRGISSLRGSTSHATKEDNKSNNQKDRVSEKFKVY